VKEAIPKGWNEPNLIRSEYTSIVNIGAVVMRNVVRVLRWWWMITPHLERSHARWRMPTWIIIAVGHSEACSLTVVRLRERNAAFYYQRVAQGSYGKGLAHLKCF
jgi:hypothetical protein